MDYTLTYKNIKAGDKINEYTEMHKRVVKGYFDVREALGDWPKQSQVAKHLNVSHGTVSKAVRELNGLGVISGGYANIKVKKVIDINDDGTQKPTSIKWLCVPIRHAS